MSQGDYIRLKQIRARLCNAQQMPTDLPPVLSSQDYTDFASFCVASTVINTIPTDNCLDISGDVYIFDVPLNPDTIPSWFSDKTAVTGRNNRVLNADPNFQESCTCSLYPTLETTCNRKFYPMTQKQQDVAQCHVGCPFNTTLAGNRLKWPGDNRIKPVSTGHLYKVGWRYR